MWIILKNGKEYLRTYNYDLVLAIIQQPDEFTYKHSSEDIE